MSEPRIEACQGKALALLAMVFVAGAGSGALGHWAAAKDADHPSVVWAPHVDTVEVFDRDQLREDLDLTDEQYQTVQFILDQSIMVEADLMDQIRGARREGKNEILAILTPEQLALFDQKIQRASAH